MQGLTACSLTSQGCLPCSHTPLDLFLGVFSQHEDGDAEGVRENLLRIRVTEEFGLEVTLKPILFHPSALGRDTNEKLKYHLSFSFLSHLSGFWGG